MKNSLNGSSTMSQHLTFFVAGDEYAIGILHVREILEPQPVTKVPSTPPFIRGVMNVRGAVVPVIDLALKFKLGESATTRRSCIIIVDVDWDETCTTIGLMADTVGQVIDLGPGDVEPPPTFGTRVQVEYLSG